MRGTILKRKDYEYLYDIFLDAYRKRFVYAESEDFIQECFLAYLELNSDIKKSIQRAVDRTHPKRPLAFGRKYMYEIPIGVPDVYVDKNRQIKWVEYDNEKV